MSSPTPNLIELAGRDAAAFGLNHVTPVVMLLSMTRQRQSDAALILAHFDVDSSRLLPAVEALLGARHNIALSTQTKSVRNEEGKIVFSAELYKAYEQAGKQAEAQGKDYSQTPHMLLGILEDSQVKAALARLKVHTAEVHEVIISYLEAGTLERRPGPSAAGAGRKQLETAGGVPEGSTADGSQPLPPASKTPTLDTFGRDLTKLAREGKLDRLVGREKEVNRSIRILGRRTKNNPLLVGDPGVGKTAIAEGIAARIAAGKVPACLKDRRLVQIELATLVAGTKYRGEFEERILLVVKEAKESNILLFIDELHTLVGGGGSSGGLDASNILKPALSRGELTIMGATTVDEFRKHFQKDAALNRRFQEVNVEAATVPETIEIIKGLRPVLEKHHRLLIGDDAIEAAALLSDRYIGERQLPDKAIDLIDEAASALALEREAFRPVALLAAPPAMQESLLQRVLRSMPVPRLLAGPADARPQPDLLYRHIAALVSEITGVPGGEMEKDERVKLLGMEGEMGKKVVGQDAAIKAVSQAVRRARANLRDPNRPAGCFLFLGPTGVGKTQVARVLQLIRTGKIKDLVRFDMSEFMERHSVSRLIGAPPGYVGFGNGGLLTEAIRRKPYSVLLLDEIEKAHPDIFNVLLQVMDDGRLTDGEGRTIDFRNIILIMTTNAGAQEARRNGIGFGARFGVNSEKALEAVKQLFSAEFINRLDEMIFFDGLTRDHIEVIVEMLVDELKERLLSEHRISLAVDASAIELLVETGFDPVYGARPMKRAVQRLMENPLADGIIGETFKRGMTLSAVAKGELIDFQPVVAEEGPGRGQRWALASA
ncbi:MAG: ATP-dependent Clp protease ATP-binding subunit [Candidatus Melainabacteria bacterium]|nr:ATP-dependent Clp protease ATP-binding subunit [Candidatus Melainabacteria bacterium]